MTLHFCKYCEYSTQKKALYDEHITRPKHKNNFLKYKNNILNKVDKVDKIDRVYKVDISGNIIEKIDNLTKQNEEVIKQNEELRKEI